MNTMSSVTDYPFYKFYPVIAILMILMLGWIGSDASISISADKLSNQILIGKAPLILDTRSNSEYKSGHLPGAVYFPFWKAFFADESILEYCKKEPVVVYCQDGPRASFAKFALLRIGCDKVVVLDGHMSGWIQQELPLSFAGKHGNTDKK